MHTGFPSEAIRATFSKHCICLIIYLKNKKIGKSGKKLGTRAGPIKRLLRAILSDQVQKGEEISLDSKFMKISIFRARNFMRLLEHIPKVSNQNSMVVLHFSHKKLTHFNKIIL